MHAPDPAPANRTAVARRQAFAEEIICSKKRTLISFKSRPTLFTFFAGLRWRCGFGGSASDCSTARDAKSPLLVDVGSGLAAATDAATGCCRHKRPYGLKSAQMASAYNSQIDRTAFSTALLGAIAL